LLEELSFLREQVRGWGWQASPRGGGACGLGDEDDLEGVVELEVRLPFQLVCPRTGGEGEREGEQLGLNGEALTTMELWDVKVVAREVLVEDLEVCKQESGWPLLKSCGQMN
jgi:hypothetical protein